MDEFTYEKICRTVLGHLNKDTHYCVNLAGGTRYMALAVQQVFEKFDTEFFYVQVEENLIVKSKFDDSIYDNDDRFFPIRHRMSVAEYLHAHDILHNLGAGKHTPIRSEAETAFIFRLFSRHELPGNAYETMELLRKYYRNRKRVQIKHLETTGGYNSPAVPGLTRFLIDIGFVPETKGVLSHEELEYLTGGWFEEYVYHQVKKYLNPQDIALSVVISRQDIRHNNELDVVFTKGNKLFVIECKTGVQTERLFNEIVYKVCAISEALLGVSCNPYIFSLKKDDSDILKRIADNMGITFIDNNILTNSRKMQLAMTKINIQAKDFTM